MARKKTSAPMSVFNQATGDDGVTSAQVNRPSPEFIRRTMGATWVQLTGAGARVIHTEARAGDVRLDTAVMVSGRMSPRKLGSAHPDTEGKGSAWTMDRTVHL